MSNNNSNVPDGLQVVLASFQKSLHEIFGKGDQSQFKQIPQGGNSLDIHRIGDVTTTTKEVMLPFRPPKGFTAFISHFALFSDALLETEVEFIPEINGQRVLSYHGNPQFNKGKIPYRLSVGMSADLSNTGLRACNLVIRDTDELIWYVTQLNANAQTMGIRCVGYLMSNSKVTEPFTGS